jgi:hypothetical protein
MVQMHLLETFLAVVEILRRLIIVSDWDAEIRNRVNLAP